MTVKRLFLSVLMLCVLVVRPADVEAHGFIVRSVPADRVTLERAPTRLQYWFSEGLEPNFSRINVRNQNGEVIATGGTVPETPTLLRVQLPPDLPEGAYIVELRPAFISDGHVVTETRVFFVGDEVGGVSSTGQTTTALPLEVLWRAITYAASMLLFGTVILYSRVLVPAWGSAAYPAGGLPPRVMRRLNQIMGVSLVLALIGNVIALLQQATAFFNTGIPEVIQQNLWGVVRIGSRFGDVWNVRIALLLLAAALFAGGIYYRQSQPGLVRAFWNANVWVLALVLGTFSILSHAAGALLMPWFGIAIDWLHLIGVGFWVGGLLALVWVLPVALQPYDAEQKRQALVAVLRHFSRVAFGAAFVVISSGIYSALMWVSSPRALVDTPFGLSLMVKTAMVMGLLGFGALHYVVLHPERFSAASALVQRVQLPVTLRLEVILAALTLMGAAVLASTPFPVPDFVKEQAPAPTDAQTVGDYRITQTITPGGPGVNTYDLQISHQDGTPADTLMVNVQQVYPERDLRRAWQPADPLDGGLYVAADGAIDRPGHWWTLIDITDADGTLTRAAFTWDISADASVIQSQPPGIQHLLGLGLVGAVLLWICYPMLLWFYRLLDLSPTNVTIVTFAIVASAGMMVFGYLYIEESHKRYVDVTNPPPVMVNDVLPDADSLARGAAAYAEACETWQTRQDFALLQQRMPTLPDVDLYQITQTGWRGLPSCDVDETVRWDLVNYLRTLVNG